MKVIRRLKKLIAHQQSAKKIGSLAEAEVFAVQIQKLLDKYNLSMSDVELSEDENLLIDGESIQSKFKAEKAWQFTLLNRLAEINGCYALASDKGFQIIIGNEIDRKIVSELYIYFENLAIEFGENYVNSFSNTVEFQLTQDRYKNQFLEDKVNSYMYGLITKLCDRLADSHKKSINDAKESQALVFVGNKHQKARDWANSQLKIERKDSVNLHSRDAYYDGLNQGNSIALTNKVLR